LRRAPLLLPLALIAFAAGCGGDDEPAATTATTPAPTQATAPATVTQRTQTAPPPTAPPTTAPPADDEDGGGIPAPRTDTEPAPEPEPDSPTNDVPPPAGSPAERFEQECAEKPGACG
jgi:hypothetical protein